MDSLDLLVGDGDTYVAALDYMRLHVANHGAAVSVPASLSTSSIRTD